MNKKEIENKLIQNASNISRKYEKVIERWDGLVLSKDDLFVPAYIPYIGENYLDSELKILNYALSQNIQPDFSFVIECALCWSKGINKEKALNRQNISYKNYGIIQMYPFDTGHLPILSGILIYLITKEKNIDPIRRVAATNLSKFSFRNSRNRTTDSEISLNRCFDWFTKLELEILKPKYIICAGDRVYNTLKKKINWQGKYPTLIHVKFPSLLVINKSKNQATPDNNDKYELIKSIFTPEFLNRASNYKNKKNMADIIARDRHYFIRMFESMENQL